MLQKDTLDDEILREIAGVGGAYGSRLEACLKEALRVKRALSYLEKRLARQRSKVPRLTIKLSVSLRKRLSRLKEEALKYRYYLIVYREAIGLTNHRIVDEVYPVEKVFGR
ncbi:MAG: hypothetical protein GXO04_03390 [Aquificae bacterium]|nr:hypothetical protein [Aquificota bacterium]